MSDHLPTSEARRCACATIRRTDRVLTQFYDEILAPSGLYVTQFTTLATLAEAAPITINRLAAMARSTGEDRARTWPGTLRRPADRPLRCSRGGQLKLPRFLCCPLSG